MLFRNFFRHLFVHAAHSPHSYRDLARPLGALHRPARKNKNRVRRSLGLESLEDRCNPAPFGALPVPQSSVFDSSPKSILFVDRNLAPSLPAAETSGSLMVLLDPERDFFGQIGQGLAGLSDLNAVRLITHGQAGGVLLGTQVIDDAALNAHASLVRSWGSSLAPGADFLVYGCSVAATSAGTTFLKDLSRLTGADVAGSTDLTGAKGDTALEFSTGKVTQTILAAQKDWAGSGLTLGDTTTTTVTYDGATTSSMVYGQILSYLATVVNTTPNFGTEPTGSVEFKDEFNNSLGTVALVAGLGGTYTSTATLTLASPVPFNVGSHQIVAYYTSDTPASFDDSSDTPGVSQDITPAALTVTADPNTKTYGSADPTLTYNYSGLANGDTVSIFTGALSRNAGETVSGSPYAITQGSLDAGSNYTINFTGNTFTITTATLIVTADPKTKVYGSADPTLTYSYSGLTNGDTSGVFTGSLIRTVGETVLGSPYAISQGSLDAGSNYTINFTGNTFTITTATLIVTADPKTKVYGSADPTLTYSYSGLTNGDTSGVFTGSLIRTVGETVLGSPYAISQGSLDAGSNYTINFTGNTFTITTATLIVTADPKTKVYGSADPALTYTYSGLTNGDTAAVFTGSLIRAAGESVAGSPYAITQNTLGAGNNYTISYTGADFTITKKALTITASNVSGTYASISLDGATGFTSSGLNGAETIGSVTLTSNATLSTSGNFNYSAAPWTLTPSAATGGTFDPNDYSISYVSGSLTVTKKALTISATGVNKIYDGTTNATVTLSDDRVTSDLFTDSYASAIYTTDKHVGTSKPISVTGISIAGTDANNYTFNTTAATTADITKKAVTFTIGNATQTYGSPVDLNPTWTPSPYNQAGSAFYSTPVDITNFTTRFSFQSDAYTSTPADGITFVIQNAGLTALGANGEGLGYQGIGNSVAIKVDLIDNYGEGTNSTGIYYNGVNPSNPAYPSQPLTPKGLNFQSNHVFTVDMTYNGTTLLVIMTDTVSRLSSYQSYAVNIASKVGAGTAFVGFTGGTGVLASKQNILSWDFKNGPTTVIDYSSGFVSTDSATLALNGNAVLRGGIVLTGPKQAAQPVTGIFTEDLILLYNSQGNLADSDVNTYPISATVWDGSGWVSDYNVTLVPGTLTVSKKSVSYTISNSTQTYGAPVPLNPTIAADPYNQAGSAFYLTPVDITSFTTKFTFQTVGVTDTLADGLTFTIQRKGAGALGSSGEGLGYQGITKSVAIKFDNFDNAGEGSSSTGVYTGGANPSTVSSSVDLIPSEIDFTTNHIFQVQMTYGSSNLQVIITDTNTGKSQTKNYTIDIPSTTLGTTGYVGFTGGTGSLAAKQSILSWTYTPGSGTPIDYSTGFSGASSLFQNGDAGVVGSDLVLTCPDRAEQVIAGANGEYLNVDLASSGHTVNSPVGTYPITGTATDGTGLVGNYNTTITNGILTVTKADLVITAAYLSNLYGVATTFTGSEYTQTGLAGTDTITGVFLSSPGSSAGSNAGTYAITPSAISGTGLSNYNITYVNGTLTILKANLNISADNKTKVYGDSVPTLTATYTGLVNGDLPSVVSGLYLQTDATAFSDVGFFPITLSSQPFATNYNITTSMGMLSVTKKAISYTVADQTQTQGTATNLNTVTPNPYNQAGSAFYSNPVNIASFTSHFTFQTAVVERTLADGFTFTIQANSPQALGLAAEGLGYQGMGHSVAVKFDYFNNAGEGINSTGLYSNGASPTSSAFDLTNSDIDLQSMHAFAVDLTYNGTTLTVVITDQTTHMSATQSYTVDIAGTIGASTAYVGFTGGTGALTSKQSILDFNYKIGGSPIFDYASGFAGAAGLSFNGSAVVQGANLVLTAPTYGAIINTGVNNETLYLLLDSLGNTDLAAIGTYIINSSIYSGTGKASNYQVTITNGQLTVV